MRERLGGGGGKGSKGDRDGTSPELTVSTTALWTVLHGLPVQEDGYTYVYGH